MKSGSSVLTSSDTWNLDSWMHRRPDNQDRYYHLSGLWLDDYPLLRLLRILNRCTKNAVNQENIMNISYEGSGTSYFYTFKVSSFKFQLDYSVKSIMKYIIKNIILLLSCLKRDKTYYIFFLWPRNCQPSSKAREWERENADDAYYNYYWLENVCACTLRPRTNDRAPRASMNILFTSSTFYQRRTAPRPHIFPSLFAQPT